MVKAVSAVTIDRKSAGGRYCDVLDAAEMLAADRYGSTVNALVQMARNSDLYREATQNLKKTKRNGNGKAA